VLPLRGDVDLVRLWAQPLPAESVAALAADALTPRALPQPIGPSPATLPAPVPPGTPGAPPAGPPLTPVAPGATVAAMAPAATATGPRGAPGAPPRACVVRASRTRVRAARRTVLTVRVAVRKKPLRGGRVVATQRRGRRVAVLGTARTSSAGAARLRLRPRGTGRVHVRVSGRTDCSAVALRVLRG
jgi:hypothetical protein